MRLLKAECKKQISSLFYILIIFLFLINWHENFMGVTTEEIQKAEGEQSVQEFFETERPLLKAPSKEDGFFGIKYVENPEKIMAGATDSLLSEYKRNVYATYPFGYYKAVSLDNNGQDKVLVVLCEITGLKETELLNLPDGYFPMVNGSIIHIPESSSNDGVINGLDINIPEEETRNENDKFHIFTPQISYNDFKERMSDIDRMIGKGSMYSMEIMVKYFGIEEMSYEEAENEFSEMIRYDHLTGGFARLFCDVMAKWMGILPVFLAVFLWLKDITSKSSILIYAKKTSSLKLVIIRYISEIILILLPVILLTFESLIPLARFAKENNYGIDYMAYLKYTVLWLMPTLMVVLASGIFVTVLTDSPVAILVHIIWWFIDRGVTSLSGGTSFFALMLRHNTLREAEVIKAQEDMILANRLFYVILSFILLGFTVYILERKRRGGFESWRFYAKFSTFIKNKLKASKF